MNRSPSSFIRIYRAANSTEAHLLRGILEQHGMPVRVVGEGLAAGMGELPMDVVQVELHVPTGFATLARQLVDEYESRNREPATTADFWVCSHCSEQCPEEFAVCWNCSAERPTPAPPREC